MFMFTGFLIREPMKCGITARKRVKGEKKEK